MLLPAMCARRCRARPSRSNDGAREPRRVVRRADRLVRLAEAGQVDRDHAVALGQRGDGGEEGGLRAAEPVRADQRLGFRCRRTGSRAGRSVASAPIRTEPPDSSVGRWWRPGSRRPRAGCPGSAACRAERAHAAAHVGGDLAPGGGVGAERGVRLGAFARVTQAEAPPGDHRIAGARAGHDQPDARPPAGHVHHVRVEALCKRRNSVGRRRVAFARGRGHPPINTTETSP